ncbi:hypothetical protein SDC9_102274 [bioreactor metagenome]|uniref:Uncharacterized protein n=1 Tax=bioreactor metagenome TaxID=1076179 RepID=A0A645AQZ5_9ZZZZ
MSYPKLRRICCQSILHAGRNREKYFMNVQSRVLILFVSLVIILSGYSYHTNANTNVNINQSESEADILFETAELYYYTVLSHFGRELRYDGKGKIYYWFNSDNNADFNTYLDYKTRQYN